MLTFSRRQYTAALVLVFFLIGVGNGCDGNRLPLLDSKSRKDELQSHPKKKRPAPRALVRKDLARFHGVYGDPTQQQQPRNFFIYETCDGRLQFGAMWGDVAPWIMKPVDDNVFVQERLQPGDEKPVRIEFEVDDEGKIRSLAHTLDWRSSPLVRLGDLPDYFKERDCER